jgi:hypothetical protein
VCGAAAGTSNWSSGAEMSDVSLEIYYDGAWHDLVDTEQVRAEADITVQRGDGVESGAIRPAQITAQLDNRDDVFRMSNPESALYGRAGRNTPVRVAHADDVRGAAEASLWDCDQSNDFRRNPLRGSAWTTLEAGGLLQRIGQWKEPRPSALARSLSTVTNVTGMFPLEDQRESTTLANSTNGGPVGSFTGAVTLGSDVRPGGASRTVQVGTDGVITGRFLPVPGITAWQVVFNVKLDDDVVLTAGFQEVFRWTDTQNRVWAWETSDTDWAWRIYDDDGATLSYTASGARDYDPRTRWTRCHMRVSISGGTVNYDPWWYPEGNDVYATAAGGTFAGTSTGSPYVWRRPVTVYSDGAAYSYVFAISNNSADFINDGNALAAFNGFAGETAGARFRRLLAELELSWRVIGDVDLSEPMGPQPSIPLMDLLRECRDTDDGLIFDDRTQTRIVFMLRNARFNQTAVSVDVTELPRLPRERVDDLGVSNDVTVQQRDGGTGRAVAETGPLSILDPPDGVGRYEQTIDVNVDDESTLTGHAYWWLARGTVDVPRYPQLIVNLSALAPTRAAELAAVDIGEVIELSGVLPDPVRLIVLGSKESIPWKRARTLIWQCVPDVVFSSGTYDGTARYDLSTCTLTAAAEPTATTLTFSITSSYEAWSSTSAYDLTIAGERVRIPAGAMGARTGSAGAYSQTATGVQRSVNGVRKTLPAGSSVRVSTPGRYTR